jgi:hypothetical protein
MAPNTAGNPAERVPVVHRNADGEVEFPDPQPLATTPTGRDEPAVTPDLELPEEPPQVQPGFPGTVGPG